MPNHIHGILFINNQDGANKRATARVAPTHLGQIIGSFKSKCVIDYLNYIRKNQLDMSVNLGKFG